MIARNSIPIYFPSNFDLTVARTAAKLTEYAYSMYSQWQAQKRPKKEENFHWQAPVSNYRFSSPIWSSLKLFKIINKSEPFGFVARDKQGNGYIVFRGTESVDDWLNDLDEDQHSYELAPDYGKVHDGFFSLYKSLRNDLFSALNQIGKLNQLYITGHSLGCGLSTLAVPDILKNFSFSTLKHYNFASPRVGNPDFANAYNSNGVRTFRIVNSCDLVPNVPAAAIGMMYQHIGTPVSFTAHYGSVAGNHSMTGAYGYALENPDEPQNIGSK